MILEQFKKELRILLTQSETMSEIKRKSGAFKAFNYYDYKLKEEELEFKLSLTTFINKVLLERIIETPIATNVANALGNFIIRNDKELALAVNIIEEYCDVWVFSTLSINYYGLDIRLNNDIKEMFNTYDNAHVNTDILLGNIVRAITNYCYVSSNNVLPLSSEKEKNLLVGIATICQDIHIHDHDSIHALALRCIKLKTAIVNELNSGDVSNNPGGLTNAVNNMIPELGSAKAPHSSEKTEVSEDYINMTNLANIMTPLVDGRMKFIDDITKDTNLFIPNKKGYTVEITNINDGEDFLGESDHKEGKKISHNNITNDDTSFVDVDGANLVIREIDNCRLFIENNVIQLFEPCRNACYRITDNGKLTLNIQGQSNIEIKVDGDRVELSRGSFTRKVHHSVVGITFDFLKTNYSDKEDTDNTGICYTNTPDNVPRMAVDATRPIQGDLAQGPYNDTNKLPNTSQLNLSKTVAELPRSYSEVELPDVLCLDIINQTYLNMVNVRLFNISGFYPLTKNDELRFKDSDGNRVITLSLFDRMFSVNDHKNNNLVNIDLDHNVNITDMVAEIIESTTETKCIRLSDAVTIKDKLRGSAMLTLSDGSPHYEEVSRITGQRDRHPIGKETEIENFCGFGHSLHISVDKDITITFLGKQIAVLSHSDLITGFYASVLDKLLNDIVEITHHRFDKDNIFYVETK